MDKGAKINVVLGRYHVPKVKYVIMVLEGERVKGRALGGRGVVEVVQEVDQVVDVEVLEEIPLGLDVDDDVVQEVGVEVGVGVVHCVLGCGVLWQNIRA